jgi:hypothetical protein
MRKPPQDTRRVADALFPPDDAEQHGWKLEDSRHGQFFEVWHVAYPLAIVVKSYLA